MSNLNKFLGSPKEVEIDGKKLTLVPLKVKDMHLFSNQNATEEEKVEMSKKILKLSIEESTDEEINSMPMDTFIQIMEEINKLNGFTDERFEKFKPKTK